MRNKEVGRKVKAMRGELNLSRDHFGMLLGVHAETVKNIETGESSPKVSYFDGLKEMGLNCLPYIDGTSAQLFLEDQEDVISRIMDALRRK